jgi:ketosteroid isomerase-like protein
MRRNALAALATLVALAMPSLAAAQASPAAGAEKAVLAAQDARFALTIKADVVALGAMMTDDLTYTHSSALTETKAQLLEGLKSGKYAYREIEAPGRRVRLHGDAAIVSGPVHIVIEPGGQRTEIDLYFTELYVKEGGRWKMALWQSTKLPPPAAPAK